MLAKISEDSMEKLDTLLDGVMDIVTERLAPSMPLDDLIWLEADTLVDDPISKISKGSLCVAVVGIGAISGLATPCCSNAAKAPVRLEPVIGITFTG